MLTKSDLSHIGRIVEPIKQDVSSLKKDVGSLKTDVKILENSLRVEIREMRKEHKQYKDEVLTKLDGIAGDLGVMKDENIIGSGQTSQLREEVEDHEERIKRLEKIPQTA